MRARGRGLPSRKACSAAGASRIQPGVTSVERSASSTFRGVRTTVISAPVPSGAVVVTGVGRSRSSTRPTRLSISTRARRARPCTAGTDESQVLTKPRGARQVQRVEIRDRIRPVEDQRAHDRRVANRERLRKERAVAVAVEVDLVDVDSSPGRLQGRGRRPPTCTGRSCSRASHRRPPRSRSSCRRTARRRGTGTGRRVPYRADRRGEARGVPAVARRDRGSSPGCRSSSSLGRPRPRRSSRVRDGSCRCAGSTRTGPAWCRERGPSGRAGRQPSRTKRRAPARTSSGQAGTPGAGGALTADDAPDTTTNAARAAAASTNLPTPRTVLGRRRACWFSRTGRPCGAARRGRARSSAAARERPRAPPATPGGSARRSRSAG